jgi:hypothetical protein
MTFVLVFPCAACPSGRDAALWLGRRAGRLNPADLGKLAGGTDYAAAAKALRRLARRLETDASLQQTLKQLETAMSKDQI